MASTASAIFGAGCSNATPNRCSFTRFTWVPSPRMNLPPESSARSRADIAVMVGLRGKANAMSVPTVTRDVAAQATAACTNDERAVSATQALSNPACSTSRASCACSRKSPPITTPMSMSAKATPQERRAILPRPPPRRRRSVRQVAGRGPQALGHDLEHLRSDLRVLGNDALEHPRGEREEPDLGGRRHGGRTWPSLEQRDLPEEVSPRHVADVVSADLDLGHSVEDQEEPDPRIPLAGQGRALPVRDLLRGIRDRRQLFLRELREDGNPRQHRDRFARRHLILPSRRTRPGDSIRAGRGSGARPGLRAPPWPPT